ncbi:Parallel beta-helix repeat-containing protein [Bifidobacterium sp. DSM 109958]|uniref:Parallel beta-helix repeat-containing protein n=1 Tax=Bifidobacterium moraviense TaxID=2675323 RepID=A0A7Y0HZY3_9BIFI|nr:glycosyl hydrolase family 28 protein [Bifidobacterium sp. DSM 109958]NMN00878.1 Parallel beta-helix repeat-containing protein [Bifidobacterium sp. DSM 109958]
MLRIETYPAPVGAALRADWRVRVRPAVGVDGEEGAASADGTPADARWRELPVYRVKVDMHDVHAASMAYFDADFAAGPVEVEVTPVGWDAFYTAAVRPLSLGIEPTVEQRAVRFTLDRPTNCSVEINRNRMGNLHLFAGDLAEMDTLMKPGFDVAVEGNPNGPNTFGRDVLRRIEAARNRREDVGADAAARPVRVLVRRAHYCIEDCVMDLPSDVELVLAGGVVLDGAFRIRGRRNVAIRGRGVFDQADFKRFSGLNGVTIAQSRHVTVDGPTFVNPPHYTVMLGASSDVTIRNVKSFSCEGWSDGVDMMACRDVTVERCFLRTSDDCIAIYGSRWEYRGGSSDVTVRDCALWSDVAHPMMIGTHGDHEHDGDVLERLRFEDIDVLEHNEYQDNYLGVMAINAGDANVVRDVTWRCVRVERFRHGRVIDIETKWNKDYNPRPGRLVEHVLVDGVDVASGSGEEPSIIAGYDADHPVRDVTIRGFRRDGVPCGDAAAVNVRIGPNADDVRIEA